MKSLFGVIHGDRDEDGDRCADAEHARAIFSLADWVLGEGHCFIGSLDSKDEVLDIDDTEVGDLDDDPLLIWAGDHTDLDFPLSSPL